MPKLWTFARGLRQDEAAVRAGIRPPWSNGPVEGHVDRLKVISGRCLGGLGWTGSEPAPWPPDRALLIGSGGGPSSHRLSK